MYIDLKRKKKNNDKATNILFYILITKIQFFLE